MRNIRLTIEYDGSNYLGWQRQKSGSTIQNTLEEAIRSLTNEEIEVIGSSRTDAGVHAKGFVANFKTNSRIPADKYREAINHKLPDDIVILKSEEVEEEFLFHVQLNEVFQRIDLVYWGCQFFGIYQMNLIVLLHSK